MAFAFSPEAMAAAGDLDPTFSGDGKQTTDLPLGLSAAAATVIQPDGKIIAVGDDRAHDAAALARYDPDGSLDTTFSGDGKRITPSASAADVALQADGKIVVAGGSTLVRYNPDGSLDTTFSGDGRQTTPRGIAASVALQADGKIVVAGGSTVARYNPDGTLDPTFSGDGKQTIGIGARALTVQDDGRIVAVGGSGGGGRFALARVNTDGLPDPSFGGDGSVVTLFGRDGARDVAIQDDGRILAVGFASGSNDGDFAIARYNADGSLDTSFSHDGKQNTNFEDVDAASGVEIQDDGKIVVAGRTDVLSIDHPTFAVSGDFAVARYNADGSLDSGFSGNGKQTTDFFGVRFDAATDVALQADGEIVAVGQAHRGGGTDFGLARYATDGTLDPTFSGDGKHTTFFGGVRDRANAVAVQDDGKIVAVGHAGDYASDAPGDFAITRYNPDGSLDTTFSGDGKQTTDFGGSDEANGVAVQPDGKIVVVGPSSALFVGQRFALARYDPDGSLDTSFSGDGMQTTAISEGYARAVALQPDGKIVVAGSSFPGFALARYNTDGSLDTSFSGDGLQTTSGAGLEFATSVALQANGKIIAAGVRAVSGGEHDFALARYNPGGSLDPSFSGDGLQVTNFGGNDWANGVKLQGDGKVVVVGQADSFGAQDVALARYGVGGGLDTSFSGDGKQTTNFGAVDGASGVALQGNGKIVIAGFAGMTGFDFALARYNPGGSLDTSFSGDGKQTTNFGLSNSAGGGHGGALGVTLQADGNAVAVGLGRGPSGTEDFALARYLGG